MAEPNITPRLLHVVEVSEAMPCSRVDYRSSRTSDLRTCSSSCAAQEYICVVVASTRLPSLTAARIPRSDRVEVNSQSTSRTLSPLILPSSPTTSHHVFRPIRLGRGARSHRLRRAHHQNHRARTSSPFQGFHLGYSLATRFSYSRALPRAIWR